MNEQLDVVARELGLSEDDVTLRIDQSLDTTWNGSRTVDRIARVTQKYERTVLDEIEKSLLNQESYDEFTSRLIDTLGVRGGEPMGPLRDMAVALEDESRVAWVRSLEQYNRQPDTVTLWHAELDDRTTPGCWENHGKRLDQLAAAMPRHTGCRCKPLTVPNPDSSNASWARMGQEIVEEMAEERESGSAVARESDVPYWWVDQPEKRESRFRAFRESVLDV